MRLPGVAAGAAADAGSLLYVPRFSWPMTVMPAAASDTPILVLPVTTKRLAPSCTMETLVPSFMELWLKTSDILFNFHLLQAKVPCPPNLGQLRSDVLRNVALGSKPYVM